MVNNKKTDFHPAFYKNNYYHVYNKVVGKDKLFFNHGNYYFFLKRYKFYLTSFVETFAFCLLPNHFHLLIKPVINNSILISEQFRKFFISYTKSINLQQKRNGNLFQSNFKRKLIEDEKYLYNIVYYIHANPAHHKIKMDFIDYRYSSYKIIIGTKKTNLQRGTVLEWFDGVDNFVEFHKVLRPNSFLGNYIIEDDE